MQFGWGKYILKDGSCSKDCPAPMIRKKEASVGTYCLSPCKSDDHFLVKNGSCVLDCPVYFATKIEYGAKYCTQPCPPEQYYFPQNKSCLERCPDPLQVVFEAGAKFCKAPCSNPDDFLYDDQSCHKSCSMPLIAEGRNYCKSPCVKESEYVNADGSCQESCEYPQKGVKRGPYKICQIDLSVAQSVQVEKMRRIIKASNTVSEIGGILSCLVNSGDPISILMMPLLSMFEKIIFTETVLPGNTEFILLNQLSIENAGQGQRRLSSESVIEAKLQQAKFSTQFQNSFDERFMTMGVISLIALLISGLLKATKSSNESNVYQLLVKCDFALRWNTLIPLFISLSGDFILSSLIEFQKLRDYLGILSTLLVFRQICKISQRRRETDLQRWRFLFEGFSGNQRFFILVYFVRVIVSHLVLGLFSHYPQFQGFSMIVMSCGMCFYLIWISPIRKAISKIQYLIVELALLCYNVIFGVLAIFDFSDGSLADVFGQLMNVLYLITSVITAIIIILKIIHPISLHYKAYNQSEALQINQIQLSEMNQESDSGSLSESVHFEPLNQEEEEVNSEGQNNLGKFFSS